MLGYGLAELGILFDSREFFARGAEGYEVEFGVSGMALPSPAVRSWGFLNERLKPTRRGTIAAALDWLGGNAVHFEGSAGCFGAAGFLRALLRAANIPVAMVSSCSHFQVHFPAEGLYLSHGDDPYNGDFRQKRCSAESLLLDASVFQAWFRRGPEAARCANIGRGARDAACR